MATVCSFGRDGLSSLHFGEMLRFSHYAVESSTHVPINRWRGGLLRLRSQYPDKSSKAAESSMCDIVQSRLDVSSRFIKGSARS